uniref:Uncharacterized protein n=1 Tax=Oryza barthii TaxID=65489 RepID=A0A0D3GM89_9ORYZ
MALRAHASKLRIPAAAPRWTPPPSRPVSTAPKATLGTDSYTSRQYEAANSIAYLGQGTLVIPHPTMMAS